MPDPVLLVVGAALLLVGGLIGAGIGSSRRSYTCGCGHELALHDPETGKCNKRSSRIVDAVSHRHGVLETWEYDPCPCRQYTGALPERDKENSA